MSYDVTIGKMDFNYTSNMSKFFQEIGAYPIRFHGAETDEVAAEIGRALAKVSTMTLAELEEYDAPNGWGSWASACRWLFEIMQECIGNPGLAVAVSW
jgi:hypothetical protein